MKPVGHVRLNTAEGSAPADATIIVSGPPRSGTSFVAAALQAANLWLGDAIDHTVFEDLEISTALRNRWKLTREIDAPWLRTYDSAALRAAIVRRNAKYARWGFKVPNLCSSLVAHSGEALFRHPRAVMMFRDPVALAERIVTAEGANFHDALRIARRHNDGNIGTARRARIPILVASYEKAVAKRDAFYTELFDFCGLAVDPSDYPRIDAFVDAAGKSYLARASAPVSGYLNRYTDGVLYGWCRIAGRVGPEDVIIYADDVLVATVRADEYRSGLHKAGIGRGRHGFAVRLDHLDLPDSSHIRAEVADAKAAIANNGRTLGELKHANVAPLK